MTDDGIHFGPTNDYPDDGIYFGPLSFVKEHMSGGHRVKGFYRASSMKGLGGQIKERNAYRHGHQYRGLTIHHTVHGVKEKPLDRHGSDLLRDHRTADFDVSHTEDIQARYGGGSHLKQTFKTPATVHAHPDGGHVVEHYFGTHRVHPNGDIEHVLGKPNEIGANIAHHVMQEYHKNRGTGTAPKRAVRSYFR